MERVPRLHPILQEERPSHDIVQHVTLDHQVVRVVHVHGTVETAMDAAAAHVRPTHVSVEVKVDGVSAETERLAGVGELDVLEACDDQALVRSGSV